MGSKTRQWHIDNTYRSLIEERDNWRWQLDNCAEVAVELQAEIDQLRAALRLAAVVVFGHCDPLTTSPDELVQHFIEEAKNV